VATKEREKWIMRELVVVISGASGAPYGIRLLEALATQNITTRLIVTSAGRLTLEHECAVNPEALAERLGIKLEDENNIGARSASGSAKIEAVIICPCSGTTLGKIASGISDNLATRSALVALKERRKLILVPREAPVATIHLEQMANLSRDGAVILPASPGFYGRPKTVSELVDFVVARILDHLNIGHTLGSRWTGDEIKTSK